MTHEKDLRQRIQELCKDVPETPTSVFIVDSSRLDYGRLNKALSHASEHEKLSLAGNLLDLWLHAGESGRENVASEIFGSAYQEWKDIPMTATLTGNHNQLRFWLDKPGSVDISHCDSCGRLYLLQVSRGSCIDSNAPGIPEGYIFVASQLIAPPTLLSNGGMVFAKDERNRATHYSFGGRAMEINYKK